MKSSAQGIVLRKEFPYVIAMVVINNVGTQFIEFRKEIKDLEWVKVLELENSEGDYMTVSQMKNFLSEIK